MRVVVYHGSYGCDTGCCGHYLEVDGEDVGRMDFGHPYDSRPESIRDYVRERVTRELGAEHVADIDWEACEVFDD